MLIRDDSAEREAEATEHRQALRRELQAAFGSCTSNRARRWLAQILGRDGEPAPLVVMLSDEEVNTARRRLADMPATGA